MSDTYLLDKGPWWDVGLAAWQLRVTRDHIYKLAELGSIPSRVFGCELMVSGPGVFGFARRVAGSDDCDT